MEGKFIVIEGIDGAGTTTQAVRLHSALTKMELPVHMTEEPSAGPVGSLIRQILHGRLVSIGPAGNRAPSWGIMALLFAADRLDHLESEIVPNLNDGINVISDRYIYSSLAYQTVTSGDDSSVAWIRMLNTYARRADLVFFLDVNAQEAHRRRIFRRIGYELYEDATLQTSIAEKYREVLRQYQEGKLVIVDGNKSIDEVAKSILDETRKFFGISILPR
jgi:dTMP kinase